MSNNKSKIKQTIERLQKYASIAGWIFISAFGVTVLLILSVLSGPGAGPDRMFDGLILIPILGVGGILAFISGVLWLCMHIEISVQRRALSESSGSPD